MREYCKRLTKEDLIKNGITKVTKTGQVYRGKRKLSTKGTYKYRTVQLYVLDENGDKIKVPRIKYSVLTGKPYESYTYLQTNVPLHRIIWAWFKGEAREGYVIDHINNSKNKKLVKNNLLDCLQEITPAENLEKDRKRILKWDTNVNGWESREFIIDKLNYYKDLNEKAKAAHDAELSHKWRSSIAQWKAKLRLFDSNPERYTKAQKPKQVNECHERRRISKMLRDEIKVKRGAYNATRSASDRKAWKQAIENWKNYVKENY